MEPVTLVVYSDYLCPWCYNASARLKKLRKAYEGRVALEYRSFLLRPQAEPNRSLEKFREYTRSWMRPRRSRSCDSRATSWVSGCLKAYSASG